MVWPAVPEGHWVNSGWHLWVFRNLYTKFTMFVVGKLDDTYKVYLQSSLMTCVKFPINDKIIYIQPFWDKKPVSSSGTYLYTAYAGNEKNKDKNEQTSHWMGDGHHCQLALCVASFWFLHNKYLHTVSLVITTFTFHLEEFLFGITNGLGPFRPSQPITY